MIKSCPICRSARIGLFWDKVWGDPSMHVMKCEECALFFLDKGRGAEGQKKFDANYDKYIAARAETVSKHTDAKFEELVDESIAERFADIGRHFEGSLATLEVGAERGGFLDRLKGRVPKLTGVDACPDYHETLRGKGYAAYSYVQDVPKTERYDRICLFSLLEHIPEPFPFMAALAERLAPEGRVVIEVPSAAEPLVSLYDIAAFKSFYFQAMHPYVYSLKALDVLLEKSGLKKLSVQHKQRYGLANHLQWLKEGVPGGSPVFAKLFDGAADEAYRKALETGGQTDTLYLIAGLA
jgi:2-polyprenyl-3-methyl-5-hydroxy-6-metoxy-1,4-benzoquinol methylase